MSLYRHYMYGYPHKTAYRPLPEGVAQAALAGLAGHEAGLYLHIPFCAAKCGYCNLFSVAGAARDVMEAYARAVERQAAQFEAAVGRGGMRFTSLTLGGGTPSHLPQRVLENLLRTIAERTGVDAAQVPSVVELAPDAHGADRAAFLRAAGFSRASVGVQSFQDPERARLARPGSARNVRAALERIAAAGFPHLNIDLIYGVPGQGVEDFLRSVHEALAYGPSEFFLYPLYARPMTPLAGTRLNEAAMLGMYRAGRDFLLQHGFGQVSMRRFVRTGSDAGGEAYAPVSDCGFERTLSLGCGGRSYLGDVHMCEPFTVRPEACRAKLLQFNARNDFLSGVFSGYILDADEHRRRYAVKNLLHISGINRARYQEHFGDTPEAHFPFLKDIVEKGWARPCRDALRLTDEGLARSDMIGPMFVSARVQALSREFYHDHNQGDDA